MAVSSETRSPSEVLDRLASAVQRGEREAARRIYYQEMLTDPRLPRAEVRRWAYRLGAIDEGDAYLAERQDL